MLHTCDALSRAAACSAPRFATHGCCFCSVRLLACVFQVELFAWRCQLLRVVLTVFERNVAARRFYAETLGYELDESDPSLFDQREQYQILCKRNRKISAVADIRLPQPNTNQQLSSSASTQAQTNGAHEDSAATSEAQA